jgi:hypothetical protein
MVSLKLLVTLQVSASDIGFDHLHPQTLITFLTVNCSARQIIFQRNLPVLNYYICMLFYPKYPEPSPSCPPWETAKKIHMNSLNGGIFVMIHFPLVRFQTWLKAAEK